MLDKSEFIVIDYFDSLVDNISGPEGVSHMQEFFNHFYSENDNMEDLPINGEFDIKTREYVRKFIEKELHPEFQEDYIRDIYHKLNEKNIEDKIMNDMQKKDLELDIHPDIKKTKKEDLIA